ncbi:hypothetical protein GDO81_003114 [Engystomops pustulosus]|uniref:Uncharacterized protein n=1 Tax=Engystomops pustulosus TaxID=76066 RepID=A0AAV6ZWI8_ENGPU|nr:hypothetical protein GDO81_003114 [Engystomops pustulosus]KAG8552866.1 hypothetical protein GDO81_003114 [Engystomops pustulosus]
MDIPLRTLTLLALCMIAVNSAYLDPSPKPATEKVDKISDTPITQRKITLNITIYIPPSATNSTKIVSTSLTYINSNLVYTIKAQRSGSDASCPDKSTDKSCITSPEEPELKVMVYKIVESKDTFICAGNVTDENLSAVIDTEGPEITVHANKSKGEQNTATATIKVVSKTIHYAGFSKVSSGISLVVSTTQTLEPTATIPTMAKATSEKTTQRHIQETAKLTTTTTTTTPTSMGESSLCRGPLSGLIFLVLLLTFLCN